MSTEQYGDKLHKRFKFPKGCAYTDESGRRVTLESVVVRELDGKDELDAAMMADASATQALKESVVGTVTLAENEAIRISIAKVNGHPVNLDGVPFLALDRFNLMAKRAMQAFFADLNGVSANALKSSVSAGVVVGAAGTEQEEKPAPDATGSSAG